MTAEKSLYKCSNCGKEFKYDSERKRHEQSHSPQFKCKVCSKNFSFMSALRRHEKQHDRNGTVKCDDCGREFRDQVLLKRHARYAHGGVYTCPKCDTTFYSEPALRTHMQTHKSESERRYECSFQGCSKKFNFAHHLKHHELTHTNSKQHFCKICGKGFIQFHHLKTHLKTHSGDSSLYCTFPDCNKKFATEYAKKRHVMKYHIKTDSGISSDSNSACDTKRRNILKDEVLDDDNISSEFNIAISKHTLVTSATDCYSDQYTAEDLSMPYDYREKNIDIENEVNSCEAALGRCIMHEEGESCVCKQIKKNNNIEYDFTPIEPDIININKLNLNDDCKTNECCAGTCGKMLPIYDKPEIEYKTDGTIKIKEFLDIDIAINDEVKFVPYNSCKAVLGNCIVSGDGTIAEGCLCAKMALDEQATAQEIEDITPHPNVESLNNQYYRNMESVTKENNSSTDSVCYDRHYKIII